MIAYKVVRVGPDIDGTLEAFYSYTFSYHTMEYEVGREIIRDEGCGPMATFRTINDALDFIDGDYLHIHMVKVFECEIVESKDRDLWCWSEACVATMRKERFDLPDGTVLADVVKLTREIPTETVFVDGQYRRVLSHEVPA